MLKTFNDDPIMTAWPRNTQSLITHQFAETVAGKRDFEANLF